MRGRQGRTQVREEQAKQAIERERQAAVRIQAIGRGRMARKRITALQTKRAGVAEAKAALEGVRIGIDREVLCGGADPCVMRAFDEACAKLAAEGAIIVDVKLP